MGKESLEQGIMSHREVMAVVWEGCCGCESSLGNDREEKRLSLGLNVGEDEKEVDEASGTS